MVDLARKHPAWGHRKIWAMARHGGHQLTMSTVLRVLRDEGLLLEASYQRERRRLAAERKAAFCDPPLGWWPPWRAAASTDRDDPVVLMRFVGRWTSRRSRVMRLMIIVQGRWVSLAGERDLR